MKISSDFTNQYAVTFCAVLVETGERYGLRGALVADKPLIEFYNRSYNYPEWGKWFVSRYYVETLRQHPQDRGIWLDGQFRHLVLTSDNMAQVRRELFPL